MCIILSRALIHLPACSTIAWLYVYDCICMIVCVRLYDNVRMMLSWRSQDHIQLVKTCNRQWLRVYEFMLVACRRFINNLVNSRTEWWTQKCAKWTLAPYVFVLLLMGMRHVPVCDIIAWLYVYACICMIVRVLWFDNVRMMSWWQTQDHIQMVAACHPTWLPLYQFMLVEIPGEVPEGSDVDTLLGPGGFRCRHLVSFWRVPVQIPVEVPGHKSYTIVQHHCMLVCVWLYLYDCLCMIVWQCAHDVIGKITWLLELVMLVAYNPTWLRMSKNDTKQNFQVVGMAPEVIFHCRCCRIRNQFQSYHGLSTSFRLSQCICA